MVAPMETAVQTLTEQLGDLWSLATLQARLMLLPSRLWQIAIVAGCIAAAFVLTHLTRERLREWLRTREGWPKWRLRSMLVVVRRLRLIWFVAAMWAATAVMMATQFYPSRYYLLELAAQLALVWLLVVFAVHLVRNPTLRRFVRWGLWTYATLYFLGITEEVARVLDGVAYASGDFRISLLNVVLAVVLLAVLITAARFASNALSDRIRRNEDMSPSMRVLAVKVMQILLFGAAFFVGLKAVGVDLTGLAVLSGAIGIGLGFGLQKVVSNLVSGVIILLDKSIKPGDVISIGDTFGWIMSLGARYVSITTRDGREYLIPNEDLITGQVVNWSHSNELVRLDIHFGTAYGDDPHHVRRTAIAAASAVTRVLPDPRPVCHITGFGDSSVDYILRFWITDPTAGLTNIRGNVFLALWDAFRAEDITIPFPQREVKVLDGSAMLAPGLARRPTAPNGPPDEPEDLRPRG